MRKVHIGKSEYQYLVGRYNVKIVLPSGKSVVRSVSEVIDKSWTDIERYCWKNRLKSVPVHPSKVKSYIERHLSATKRVESIGSNVYI